MADLTPDQWLTRLAQVMDLRVQRFRDLRARMDGNGPLPEGSAHLREAYRDFQRKSRTNWADAITRAVTDRMVISGVRVNNQPGDDDQARRIMRRNRLAISSTDVHNDMVGLGFGAVSVTGLSGRAVITYERPEQVCVESDPLDPWITRASLKLWHDDVSEADYAVLSLPGETSGDMYRWHRPAPRVIGTRLEISATGSWEPIDRIGNLLPFVTIVPFWNENQTGEFEQHTDVMDRIDFMVLQRLVIVAMQAFRQRATKGDLPEHDEAGDLIDYGALLRPGAGALWHLPDGVELWESQVTDITPLLSGVKDDLRDLSASTRTPMSTLVPDGANQTAEGAEFAREGLIFKTGNRIERARASWNMALQYALAIESSSAELVDVETQFLPPSRVTLAEKADASSKAAADLPWRDRITDIWGFDQEAADRMEIERAKDAALVAPPTAMPAPPAI